MRRSRKGVTLIEGLITVALLAFISLAFSRLFKQFGTAMVQGQAAVNSTMASQQLFAFVENDFYTANQILVAGSSSMTFICDLNRSQNYNPKGDIDNDSIPNDMDADVDNDETMVRSSTQGWTINNLKGWRTGLNLVDDDDDGDGNVDMQVRIYLETGTIVKEININQAGWTWRKSVIKGVKAFELTYFGNMDVATAVPLDLGADQIANTNDFGENDGQLSQAEIDVGADGKPNTSDAGEKDGRLDRSAEIDLISQIRLHVEFDSNNDSKTDFMTESVVTPPLIALKRNSP